MHPTSSPILRAEAAEVSISCGYARCEILRRPDLILQIAYLIYGIRYARAREKKNGERATGSGMKSSLNKGTENSLYLLLQILQEEDKEEYLYPRRNIFIQQRI